MSTFRHGQELTVIKGIQRSTGAAWPGDRVTVVGVDSPWIGPDTYTVRTRGGELLKSVPENHFVEAL